MSKKLFVGNLPFSAKEEELREAFAGVGEVVAINIIIDRQTGRSKGFGFVEMGTEELAQAAITKLHGADYDGRIISVSIAKPMEPRAPRGPRGPRE